MDTLVCVKAVPKEAPQVRVADGVPAFERAGAGSLILNECDDYAVDQAVQLKKRFGGRVTAVTVGSLSCQEALYLAVAKGCDDALRVDAEQADSLTVARLLAAVARQGSYDLILAGVESWEDLASAVPPALAALLDLPFATAVAGLDVEGGRLLTKKEMGGGYYQALEMPLPAVVAVQSGVCRLSYAPTMRVLQARRLPPRSVTPASLGVEMAQRPAQLVAIEPPRHERDAEMISGPPAQVAAAICDCIERALHG